MAFRPLDKPRGGIDLAEWSVLEQDESIDGVSCCVIKHQVGVGISERLALAKDGSFRVIRYTIMLEGKWPASQVTIRYVDQDGVGKVPVSWTGFDTSAGGPVINRKFESTVTVLETNPKLPDSEFEYQFPPGAVITDETSRKHYIARVDGSLRLITEDERKKGIAYDVLMKTDPPRN